MSPIFSCQTVVNIIDDQIWTYIHMPTRIGLPVYLTSHHLLQVLLVVFPGARILGHRRCLRPLLGTRARYGVLLSATYYARLHHIPEPLESIHRILLLA